MVVTSREALDELMKQDRVVVGLGADWCEQSTSLGKHLETLSKDSEVTIAWVDPTKIEGVSRQYGVNCVPMVLGVEKGEVRERHAGRPTASQLQHMIAKERIQELSSYASDNYL